MKSCGFAGLGNCRSLLCEMQRHPSKPPESPLSQAPVMTGFLVLATWHTVCFFGMYSFLNNPMCDFKEVQ